MGCEASKAVESTSTSRDGDDGRVDVVVGSAAATTNSTTTTIGGLQSNNNEGNVVVVGGGNSKNNNSNKNKNGQTYSKHGGSSRDDTGDGPVGSVQEVTGHSSYSERGVLGTTSAQELHSLVDEILTETPNIGDDMFLQKMGDMLGLSVTVRRRPQPQQDEQPQEEGVISGISGGDGSSSNYPRPQSLTFSDGDGGGTSSSSLGRLASPTSPSSSLARADNKNRNKSRPAGMGGQPPRDGRSSALWRASIKHDQLTEPVKSLVRRDSSTSKKGLKVRSKALRDSIFTTGSRPSVLTTMASHLSSLRLSGRDHDAASFSASDSDNNMSLSFHDSFTIPPMPALERKRTSYSSTIVRGKVQSTKFFPSQQHGGPINTKLGPDGTRTGSRVRICKARAILEETVENENDGFLSIQNGFMPVVAPLQRFITNDERLVAWDDLVDRMGTTNLLAAPNIFRKQVDDIECIPVDVLTDKELLRASSILGTIVQTYWYCGLDRREPRQDLLRAWGTIRKRLNWHVEDDEGKRYYDLPFYTLFDYSTYNWRHEGIDGGRPYDANALSLDKMHLNVYQAPPLDRSETIFYAAMALIVAKGARLPILCVEAQEAAARKDDDRLAVALIYISRTWEAIIDVFAQLNSHHGAGKQVVDAVKFSRLFANTAIPIPVTRETAEGKTIVTPSTGQSVPLFQLMDYFFNRSVFTGQQGEDVARHVSAYPRRWREFICAVRDPDGVTTTHIDEYVRRSGNLELQGLFTLALQTYAGDNGFLGRHFIKMYGYLAMLFRTGREATMGGIFGHPLDRSEDKIAIALRASRRERLANRPGEALRHVAKIHEKAVPLGMGDTSMWSVVLDVQNQGVRCSLGDHLRIFPKNLVDVADRFCFLVIHSLDLDPEDEVTPHDLDSWSETLNYFLGEDAPSRPRIADIALYGDVRKFLTEETGEGLTVSDEHLISIEELQSIKPLVPRLYSISVVQTDKKGDVAFLYMTIHEWTNGVASRLLIHGQPGSQVIVQIYRSQVLRQLNACRTIYFASGTGISPFTNFYSDNRFPHEQWLIWMTKQVSNDLRSDFKFICRYNQKLQIDALQTEYPKEQQDARSLRQSNGGSRRGSTARRRSTYRDKYANCRVISHNYLHHDIEGSRGERLKNFFYAMGPNYERLKSWIAGDVTVLACGNVGFVMEVVSLLQTVFDVDIAKWAAIGRLRVECFGSPGAVGSYDVQADGRVSVVSAAFDLPSRYPGTVTPWDVLRSALPSHAEEAKAGASPLMVLGENVYRLTPNILNIHPAGRDSILLYQGTDGTRAFVAVGHDKDGNATGMLQSCHVGKLNIPSSLSTSASTSFDVVRMGWDCAEMRNCHLLDDSLHDRLKPSKGQGDEGSSIGTDMDTLAELHTNAIISTHRRVIHIHYPRIVSLVKGACEEFCPSVLDTWKDDKTLQMTAQRQEQTHPVWMANTPTSTDSVSNTELSTKNLSPIPFSESTVNEVRVRDRAFMASCVSNAARLCEAIGSHQGDARNQLENAVEYERTVKDILSSWKVELESFVAHESDLRGTVIP